MPGWQSLRTSVFAPDLGRIQLMCPARWFPGPNLYRENAALQGGLTQGRSGRGIRGCALQVSSSPVSLVCLPCAEGTVSVGRSPQGLTDVISFPSSENQCIQ